MTEVKDIKVEIMLAEIEGAGITFPKSLELLGSKNIWIADTGASNHMTFDKTGASNIRKGDLSVT